MHPKAIFSAIRGRLRAVFRRDRIEQDLSEEIRFHFEMEIEKNIRAGMSADDAQRKALAAFGGVDRVREAHRDARGARIVDDAIADIRYAVRGLARTPVFVSISVLTLAIAIGVGTTLFGAVNGFLYAPLPVPNGGDLISVYTSDFSDSEVRGGSSYRDLMTFSEQTAALAELAGQSGAAFGITGADDNISMVSGALVSTSYFRTLRASPHLGQFPGSVRVDEPAVVLSYAVWRRMFAAESSIIGQKIRINGQFFAVAAIAPPNFLGTLREVSDGFWIDAQFASLLMPRHDLLTDRRNRRFHLIGRLHDGVSIQQLGAKLTLVAAGLAESDPVAWTDSSGHGRRVTVMYEQEGRVAGIASTDLLVLVGGVSALGFGLIAVACTNLASMQMARAAARRREIATRLALGAGRGRIVRQLLTESALVAVPGVLLGLAMTRVLSTLAKNYRPADLPNLDVTLDVRVLAFSSCGLVLALCMFGLMPALQSVRVDVLTDLKAGDQLDRGGSRIGRIRRGFIVAQVALSVMFVASSGLIALALARRADDSRVDGQRVLLSELAFLPAVGDSMQAAALTHQLVDAVRQIPGVQAASAARFVPMPGTRMTANIRERNDSGTFNTREVDVNQIRPRYFDVVGLPLLGGRDFDERDLYGELHVAIVSRQMQQRLWPGENAIGKWLHIESSDADVEIVGVVGELRTASQSSTQLPGGTLYVPLRPGSDNDAVLHVRLQNLATSNAARIVSQISSELRQQNTRVVAREVMSMDRYLERVVIAERITARVSGILAGLQLLLCVAGLSGLVAYVTALRKREIGIRSALGARSGSILALVMRQGATLTMMGGAIGALLSFGVARVISATLPINAGIELRALGTAVFGLVLVAGGAMLFTALKALAVTPASALRAD